MHQQYGFVEYRGEEDADYVSCGHMHCIYSDFTQCTVTEQPTHIAEPYLHGHQHGTKLTWSSNHCTQHEHEHRMCRPYQCELCIADICLQFGCADTISALPQLLPDALWAHCCRLSRS